MFARNMRLMTSFLICVLAVLLCFSVASVSAARSSASPLPQFQIPEIVTLPFADKKISNVTELTTLDDGLRIIRCENEVFLMYIYDSLDVNSWRTAPTVAEAAGLLLGFVDVVAIDSRNVNLAFLLSAWNVQILPSLYILPVHVSHRQGLGQGLAGVGGVKRPVEYTEQDLHPDSIRNWALKQLPANLVERIDDTKLAGLQAGVAQAQSSVALLFTDKESTPPLLRRLSLQFAHRIAFVEINGKRSPKAAKHFKATTFPTLLVVPGPGYSADRNPVAYKGALKISEIVDFLSPYAPSPEERERVRRLTEESAIRLEARRLAEDVLEIATASDWEQDVLSRQAVVGVLFGSRVNSADEVKEKLAVLADAKQRSGRNSVVSQYFYIDVSGAESGKSRLQQQLGGASDDGSPVLVFLHPSKGLFLRFAGAFTVQGVMQFVSGKVRSGMTGAKSVTTSALKADF